MKENLKAFKWFVLHFTILLGFPFCWVYGIFINKAFIKIELLEQGPSSLIDFFVGGFSLFITMYPAFYLLFVPIYLLENKRIYQYLSFSHLRTNVYINNDAYVYEKVFASLAEMVEKKPCKRASGKDILIYEGSKVSYSMYDEKLKKTFQVNLKKDEFYIKSIEKSPKCSYYVKPKKHDRNLYQGYFKELYMHAKENEQKKDERRKTAYEKEVEVKKVEQRKIAKQQQLQFEALLTAIMDMKKQKKQEETFTIGQDTYIVKLDKRNIIVKKNKDDVYLKCTMMAEKAIVYLEDQENFNPLFDRLGQFYEDFTSKKTKKVPV